MGSEASVRILQGGVEARRAILLWCLFFLLAFGLGYPTLNRYDPRITGGDAQDYSQMVLHKEPPDGFPFSSRTLVPEIARPFYLLAKGRAGTWDPVLFGLLISNCLFCATATFLLMQIGLHVLHDLPVALLGCTLYLLNFVVPNLWLSGLVDSSEGCMLLLLAWSMLTRRWWLLPLVGVVGGFAKQSFLPFASTFAFTWWLAQPKTERTYRKLVWVATLGIASTTSVILASAIVAGTIMPPWAMAERWNTHGNIALQFWHEFAQQDFWYAFAWLLPLGAWRLNRLSKPWVAASLATGLFAIIIGGYADLGGTVNRPLFNVIGPVFSLSAALFLTKSEGRKSTQISINDDVCQQ